MNPSQFPQVLRSRSRSPSPAPRRLHRSDVGLESDSGDSSNRTTDDQELGNKDGGHLNFSFPCYDFDDTLRDANGHRYSQTPSPQCSGFEEADVMANIEIVNAHHSINSESHQRLASVDLLDSDSETEPHPHHTGPPTTTPGRDSAEDSYRNCDGKVRGLSAGYGSCGGGGGDGGGSGNYGATAGGGGDFTADQVDQLRRRVKFFFMDPCSKFKARRHIPWKMGLQFIKILIITGQLIQFGYQRSDIVEYFEHNQRTLQHLLLKDWNAGYETMPYPPATGVYALYSADDLLDYIQHAWSQYYNLCNNSLATINPIRKNGTVVAMRLCNTFNNYDEFPNGSYIVGPGVLSNCTDLTPLEGKNPHNIRAFLKQNNITIPFARLQHLTLDFPFTTFHLNQMESHHGPACYTVNATIHFINKGHSGQVLVELDTVVRERYCSGRIMSPQAKDEERAAVRRDVAFDVVVMVVCILSCLLCLRSLGRAWQLKRLTEKLFRERYGKSLCLSDRMEFLNLWYILIILNDICTIIGSALKIQLETRKATITSHNYDNCSLMLGLGGLTAWIGCLRYLSFFRKYNILILTLKTAFPSVLRFSLCALAMYCGFMFCGWVILGPYHIKFRHLSTTSECLYSLVNGDDMFVTFSATETDNLAVWYFSRIYLYVFISLFIYCVLSLFISVIMDTYETLKDYHDKGFPKTDLQQFMEQCTVPLRSGLYRRQHTENHTRDWSLIDLCAACCCRRKPDEEQEEERRGLLAQTL